MDSSKTFYDKYEELKYQCQILANDIRKSHQKITHTHSDSRERKAELETFDARKKLFKKVQGEYYLTTAKITAALNTEKKHVQDLYAEIEDLEIPTPANNQRKRKSAVSVKPPPNKKKPEDESSKLKKEEKKEESKEEKKEEFEPYDDFFDDYPELFVLTPEPENSDENDVAK
uniref:Uncharacterized protein n=1 Tax=Panagrolaimus sp. PS1159 TaxID=55785 RepID=A0AC35GEA8_9BILA